MRRTMLTIYGSLLALLLAASPAAAEGAREVGSEGPTYALNEEIPVNPEVKVGRLDNGLTYFIRENRTPTNRAILRLALNVGSILEEDDQQGLAHFLEHMAFNGTKSYPENELIDYLETIGMEFGPDVNAHTSFDETVYKLIVPTEDVKTVRTSFTILKEWASALTLDPVEIDKERGVVIEEWRLGRGAEARMRDKYFPVLFKGSRYAERLPIGEPEILRTFPPGRLVDFYRNWYRPDLMAVIAVGDFDAEVIERIIIETFSGIENPADPPPRRLFPVPDHEETLFSVVSDPEAATTTVQVMYKHDVEVTTTVRDYRKMIVENLYAIIMNQRLEELIRKPDPPYYRASAGSFDIVRTRNVYAMLATVDEFGIIRGLEALLTEAERVRRFGFVDSELERAKAEALRWMENAYRERGKTQSVGYAEELQRHFLDKEVVPGIEYEYELYKRYIDGIGLAEVNALAEKWITEENRVVIVKAPQKEGLELPTREGLAAVLAKVREKEIDPYEDVVIDRPLIDRMPVPSEVVEETNLDDVATTVWRLSNGVTVVMKPTDFKNNEVLFTAFSPGGTSMVSDERYISALAAASVVGNSGVGSFSKTELERFLAGKTVQVSPFISDLTEGLSGSSTVQDLETLFQLIHVYITQPRADRDAFEAYMERLRANIRNRQNQPEAAFQDEIQVTMAKGHFRERPLTLDIVNGIDMDTALEVYRERFADASDFTFVFTGNLDPKVLRPLVETYLGGLPTTGRTESWRDLGIETPDGVVRKSVRAGIEPRSLVAIIFNGPFEWSRESTYLLQSLSQVLDIHLREQIREERGGTYSISSFASSSEYPDEEYRLFVFFSADPERMDELVRAVFEEVKRMRAEPPDALTVQKVKEIQQRAWEENIEENSYWLNALRDAYFHNQNPEQIPQYADMIKALSPGKIADAAKFFLDTDRYVQVILLPATGAAAGKDRKDLTAEAQSAQK